MIIYLLFFIIFIVIAYYLYYNYFINNLNYNSFINLDNLKPINTNYNIKHGETAVIISGVLDTKSTIISQKYFIYNLLKPDIYCLDTPEFREELKEYNVTYYKNDNLSEYETVYELNKIINKQSKKYKIIIRLRADLYVKEPLPASIINNITNNIGNKFGNKFVYIPSSNNKIYYSSQIGVNDYFCIANQETFNIYANFYKYLTSNHEKKCNIIEYLLKQYLNNNNVIIYDDFNYEIIVYKLRTNQSFYIFVLLSQYIKKFNDKFHCII